MTISSYLGWGGRLWGSCWLPWKLWKLPVGQCEHNGLRHLGTQTESEPPAIGLELPPLTVEGSRRAEGAPSADPGGRGGRRLLGSSHRDQGECVFCCLKLSEGRSLPPSPPGEDPCPWLAPSTPAQGKLVWASTPPRPKPQTPHAARAACHRLLASPQSGQGWKGLKTAALLGKLTLVLQPLPPLPLLPSAVPSPTVAPPVRGKQNRTMPCATPVRRGGEQLPPA